MSTLPVEPRRRVPCPDGGDRDIRMGDVTRRRRVTIREVAQAAGVSTQTVSRVLNDRPDVAPETYERVQRVIADTGYRPNMLARSLIQGRTHILGVVAYGLEYFGPSRIITGIEQQAAAMGYSISLTLIHRPETDEVEDLLAGLAARQVDGVLWAIPEIADNRRWLRSNASATCPCRSSSWAARPASTSVPVDRHRQPRHRPARHAAHPRRRCAAGRPS